MKKFTVQIGFFPLLFLIITLFTTACSSASTSFVPQKSLDPQTISDKFLAPVNQSYTFYLFDPFAKTGLTPLAPQSLLDLPASKTVKPGIFSADGSIGVDIVYPDGRASQNPEDSWIVVTDLHSGNEQNRFHPPVRGIIVGLNVNGTRLLLQPDPSLSSRYPPPLEWYLLDTVSGQELAHVKDENNACFRQSIELDQAGQRLYCVVDPALTQTDKPESMQITAYSSESGLKIGEQQFPEIHIGTAKTGIDDQITALLLEPAVALSPDGQQLAIVHADADKITLIDTHDLAVKQTLSLGKPLTFWNFFATTTAYAKGLMTGTIRHAEFSPDGQFLYLFTQEVKPPDEKTQQLPTQRGLWLVDLERGVITAEALNAYQIQWIEPAPDGTIYVFGTTETDLGPYEIRPSSPSTLWRLDALTFEILAEREFPGYRGGRVVRAQ